MPTTDNTSSNKTRNVRAKVIYANYEIARQALLEGQSIRMPSAANADVSVLAAKAIGPIQFTPAEIASVLQSASIFPPTPSATAPGPVRDLSGTAGDKEVVLTWTAPSSNGGSPITSYTVSWTPESTDGSGSRVVSSPATTTTIEGLTNDTAYTFSVVARNLVGVGPSASVTVTPAPLPILGYYVSTFAGNQEGFNDGTGTNAQFDEPYDIGAAVDGTGAIYVADQENHRIRRIGTNGEVTTIAGGTEGFNDATGTNARFDNPTGLAVDASGTIYVADKDNHRIRKIGTDGQVTTFAGSTEGTNDATGTNAQFRFPRGVTVDGTGTVYVADSGNDLIRKIGTDGEVTTFAGGTQGTNDATGTNAQFYYPQGVTVDGTGTVYVADSFNHRIRKITAAGVVTTFAGSTQGTNDGTGTNAQFNYPQGVAVDGTGTIYVADTSNHRIRKIGTDGQVTTFAGSTSGTNDGAVTNARFDEPRGVVVDGTGTIYVADEDNHLIRKITPITIASLPLPVTDLVGPAGDEQIVLSWTAPFDPASRLQSYTVSWTPASTDGSGSRVLSGTTLTTTIGNLENGTSYTFSVVATNSVGVGPSVSLTVTPELPVLAWAVTTIAGDGTASFNEDLVGTNAQFNVPRGLFVDGSGTIYVADTDNHRIRTIGTDGQVTTIAGDGTANFNEDLIGTNCQFNSPRGVAVDGSGTIYVADSGNNRIRTIGTDGQVTTFAGNGTQGSSNGTGTNAQFNLPTGLAVDASGMIYVADSGNRWIRKITAAGVVTRVPGFFYIATGVALDGTGTVYVANIASSVIRKITAAGIITTFATGFNNPYGVGAAVDGTGTVYVADTSNHRIRKITSAGVVTTIAGDGTGAFNGDLVGTNAQFNVPRGIFVDASGTIYVADTENNRIRKITPITVASLPLPVTDLSGTAGDQQVELSWTAPFDPASTLESYTVSWTPASTDGSGTDVLTKSTPNTTTTITGLTNASEYTFSVVATNSVGVGPSASLTVTPVAPLPVLTWVVTTIAGNDTAGFNGDLVGTNAQFNRPRGIAVDGTGTIYVADTRNHRIRKIGTDGQVTTIAGDGTGAFNGDLVGTNAQFKRPPGIAVDGTGTIYVADTSNHRIRKIGTDGVVTTIAGDGTGAFNGDLVGTNAQFRFPTGVAVDATGTVYVADLYNHRIRKIGTDGEVTTYAGSTQGTNDGTGTNAQFNRPFGVAIDGTGTIYVTDSSNNRIRKIGTDGEVTTIAGNGTRGFNGDLVGTNAQFDLPYGVGAAVDGTGTIYVADKNNHRIRKITSAGVVTTIAGDGTGDFNGDLVGTNAQFREPSGIAVDGTGTIYVADTDNDRIRKITLMYV